MRKRVNKRFISIMLSLAMLLSVISVPVSADDNASEAESALSSAILDVDFNSGDAQDVSGNYTSKTYGDPTISYDPEIGSNVAYFDGSSAFMYDFGKADYEKIKNTVSLETLVKYDGFQSGDNCSISRQNGGGVGLGAKSSGRACFFIKVGSTSNSWIELTAPIEVGEWNHIVGTYDGAKIRLYINGELVNEQDGTGIITDVNNQNAYYFAIGGDPSSTAGKPEGMMKGSVGLSRIYTDVLSDEEVAQLNNEAIQPVPEADILDVDFSEGDAGDRTGNYTYKAYGDPELKYNFTIGTNAADLDGKSAYMYDFGADDYAKIKDTVTIESFVRYNAFASGDNCSISRQQGGGIGLGAKSSSKAVFFIRLNDTTSSNPWIELEAPITSGEWYHIAGTYDGETVKFYINGQLADQREASGIITNVNNNNANYFAIGADPSGNQGRPESFMNGSVGHAKIYSDALGAEDIERLSAMAFANYVPEEPEPERPDPEPYEDADIINVDFENGTAEDKTGKHEPIGQGHIQMNYALGKNAAYFDAVAAPYKYLMTDEDYNTIAEAFTMEAMFQFHTVPSSGEVDIFSNQQSGGIGIGLNSGKFRFWLGGSQTMQLDKSPVANQWYHVVTTYDKAANTLAMYLDGEQVGKWTPTGNEKTKPSSSSYLVIGGDCSTNGVEFLSNATVGHAKLYGTAATYGQAYQMYLDATENMADNAVDLSLETTDHAVAGAEINVNTHLSIHNSKLINKVEYEIHYDADLMTYSNVQHEKAAGETITKVSDGILKVTYTGTAAVGNTRAYTKNRMAKLFFVLKDQDASAQAAIQIQNPKAYASNTDISSAVRFNEAEAIIEVLPKKALDLNGDGVIGAGDIALATDTETKKAIAEAAGIYPYKRAMILTIDGGGSPWNPDGIYFQTSPTATSTWQTDTSPRKNEYAYDLFNNEFATSHTARATNPAISGQNYGAILHGEAWLTMAGAYGITSTSINNYFSDHYWMDMMIDEPKYPSVFRIINEADPTRKLAAFSEWAPITNGIIEHNLPVRTYRSDTSEPKKTEAFEDVVSYIQSDSFKDTALLFMQQDYLDHIGHSGSGGYYTNTWWNALKGYDDHYKSVIDALKEQGVYEDTLIVANADHGGSGTSHSGSAANHATIFIGIGGQTVNSGQTLEGGNNKDLAALALHGLRIDKGSYMPNSEIFDERAFLSQEELYQKNRDIENIIYNVYGDTAQLKLQNKKSETRVIDAVIELGGTKVKSIKTDGIILRQEEEDGILKLTIAYEDQPKDLAEITFTNDQTEDTKLYEIMLGTEDGKEVYSDLKNTNEPLVTGSVEKRYLQCVINRAKEIKEEGYEPNLIEWVKDRFEDALEEAEKVYKDEEATQKQVDEAKEELIRMMHYLQFTANLDLLKDAIAKAEAAIASGDYEDDEFMKAYEKLLDEAKELLKDPTALDDEIEKLTDQMEEAYKKLNKKGSTDLDISFLKEEIRLAELLVDDLTEKYLDLNQDDFKAFRSALAAAKSVAENPQSQAEIDTAAMNLLETRMELRLKPNKDVLKSLIDTVDSLNADNYTADSFAALQEAASYARSVYANPLATKEEVANAEKILKTAINNLVDKNDESESSSEEPKQSESSGEGPKQSESNGESSSEEPGQSDTKNVKQTDKQGGKNTKGDGKVKTGDSSASIILLVILMISAASLAIVFGIRKKKKHL